MNTKTYKRNEIIFRQGDTADSMFDITMGRVGIYLNYGTAEEKQLAILEGGEFFGEMGMIDHEPRSATAVALDRDTALMEITEDTLGELFQKNPAKVLMIMQQLSHNLRRLTNQYWKVCKAAADATACEAKGAGKEESAEVVLAAEDAIRYREQMRSYDMLMFGFVR